MSDDKKKKFLDGLTDEKLLDAFFNLDPNDPLSMFGDLLDDNELRKCKKRLSSRRKKKFKGPKMNGSVRKTPWINGPTPGVKKVLDAALSYVNSVPYAVSLRWVFYRLYQDGFYDSKKGYKTFEILCSRARHTLEGGWSPSTLADETRGVITNVHGSENRQEAIEGIFSGLEFAASVTFDHFYRQDHYIEIWFEARAMAGQFEHYTEEIDLVPMGGYCSIPLKWYLAKNIERKERKYGKPIIILYFGDEDFHGHEIEKSILDDVMEWSGADFELVRCGLTEEQAIKYGVPESIEKRGYQWEALPDEAASEIITASVNEYIDPEIIDECRQEAREIEDEWQEKIDEALENLKDNIDK